MPAIAAALHSPNQHGSLFGMRVAHGRRSRKRVLRHFSPGKVFRRTPKYLWAQAVQGAEPGGHEGGFRRGRESAWCDVSQCPKRCSTWSQLSLHCSVLCTRQMKQTCELEWIRRGVAPAPRETFAGIRWCAATSPESPPLMTGSYLQVKPPATTAVFENENSLSKRKLDG